MQRAVGDMQLDETDPRITGLFVEANDLLKTVDRLTGELHALLVQFPPIVTSEQDMLARFVAAARSEGEAARAGA